jgi:hypothetical protein
MTSLRKKPPGRSYRRTPRGTEHTAPPVTEVLEYLPHEDGYLQLELRRYIRGDGSARGPY